LEEDRLRDVYEAMPAVDFSGEVLQRVPSRLRVLPVPPCGWTDLGTPDRLRRCLEKACSPGPAKRIESARTLQLA
ncbi:MAG: hypothetical protein ACRDGR_05930, partial [bacterium]